MIFYITNFILKKLINLNVIKNEPQEVDIYRYGIEISISSVLNIIIILSIGIITNNFIESIIFFIIFLILRSFAGGYHANTYLKCNLIFASLFSVLLFLYKNISTYINFLNASLILIISVLIITIFSPVENSNKKISLEKKKIYKTISSLFSVFLGVISMLLFSIENSLSILILYTILLVAILIIVAKIKESRGYQNEKVKRM